MKIIKIVPFAIRLCWAILSILGGTYVLNSIIERIQYSQYSHLLPPFIMATIFGWVLFYVFGHIALEFLIGKMTPSQSLFLSRNCRLANCCYSCAHCITEHFPDDPITYYCNLDKEYLPEEEEEVALKLRLQILREEENQETRAFSERERLREEWFDSHWVRAGNICDYFRGKK